jgi:hypothetical protein
MLISWCKIFVDKKEFETLGLSEAVNQLFCSSAE